MYFLTGSDPLTGTPAAYIGETESVRERIKDHLGLDFWNQIAFFTSKDENLTKGHIRYLEGRLIEIARDAKRADLTNSQRSGSSLPESDRADMEVFLIKIQQLLPALGVEVLVPIAAPPKSMAEQETLHCEIGSVKAKGRLTPNGIVVLAGSQAARTLRPSAKDYPWVVNARQQLIDDGTLVDKKGVMTFARDKEFSSPSAAAAVIHGGTANGRTAWKNSTGRTLKDLDLGKALPDARTKKATANLRA